MKTGSIVLIRYNGEIMEKEVVKIMIYSNFACFMVEGIDDYLTGENLIEVIR